jgi:hypothetical protein
MQVSMKKLTKMKNRVDAEFFNDFSLKKNF